MFEDEVHPQPHRHRLWSLKRIWLQGLDEKGWALIKLAESTLCCSEHYSGNWTLPMSPPEPIIYGALSSLTRSPMTLSLTNKAITPSVLQPSLPGYLWLHPSLISLHPRSFPRFHVSPSGCPWSPFPDWPEQSQTWMTARGSENISYLLSTPLISPSPIPTRLYIKINLIIFSHVVQILSLIQIPQWKRRKPKYEPGIQELRKVDRPSFLHLLLLASTNLSLQSQWAWPPPLPPQQTARLFSSLLLTPSATWPEMCNEFLTSLSVLIPLMLQT